MSEDYSAVRHEVETATDGFRGPFIDDPGDAVLINTDTSRGFSQALITHVRAEHTQPRVLAVAARDPRESGVKLHAANIKGALEGGADLVLDMDIVSTPAAQKIAGHVNADATIVATASHNPYTDNGWKGMIGNAKPDDEQIKAISDIYFDNLGEAPGDGIKGAVDTEKAADLKEWYHDTVVETISEQFGDGVLEGKIFAYDGAQGASREMVPRILESLGAEVVRFACDGEGYINENCGAANIAEAKDHGVESGLETFLRQRPEIIRDPRFVGGLANDGDGDRVLGLAVRHVKAEPHFDVVNGNHFMWALAQGEQNRGGIVGTVYTNGGLRRALSKAGIEFTECKNGDRYVTEKLLEKQAEGLGTRRGGEFTGHLIDTEWLNSGDGGYMAPWYAAATVLGGMTFGNRIEELRLLHESMTAVRTGSVQKAKQYFASDEYLEKLDMWQKEIAWRDGRVVVRPSGTQPVVRVWGEAMDPIYLGQLSKEIVRDITAHTV